MTKFSTDFKLSVVKFYLENNVSKHEIARQFGVIKSEVIKWIALFENHGESGLRPRYTNYSQEFKIDVLNYMKDNGTSFRETAAIFNISSDATIGKWLKIVETHGVDALQPRKRGRLPMDINDNLTMY
ncbi:transposase [Paenisporosarcina quisquiliarum]|uniref:transposase n=1 Tax=Paenisporosarcina quisquiliarum TaxID=365346 RepID=UPI003736BBBC